MLPLSKHTHTVDPHVADTRREAMGVLKGSVVRDRLGIEKYDVCKQAWTQQAALVQSQPASHGAAHFPNCLLQG